MGFGANTFLFFYKKSKGIRPTGPFLSTKRSGVRNSVKSVG
jgi:hypothetical protein